MQNEKSEVVVGESQEPIDVWRDGKRIKMYPGMVGLIVLRFFAISYRHLILIIYICRGNSVVNKKTLAGWNVLCKSWIPNEVQRLYYNKTKSELFRQFLRSKVSVLSISLFFGGICETLSNRVLQSSMGGGEKLCFWLRSLLMMSHSALKIY